MRTILLCALALAGTQAFGQAAFPPPPPKVSPAIGVIDMHVRSHTEGDQESGKLNCVFQ